jgi:hypothetical protein
VVAAACEAAGTGVVGGAAARVVTCRADAVAAPCTAAAAAAAAAAVACMAAASCKAAATAVAS